MSAWAVALVAASGIALLGLVWTPVKNTCKSREPFRTAYNWLCQPKHPYLRKDEVGDGGRLPDIRLQKPCAIVEDGEGNTYVSVRGRYVWALTPDGKGSIVAGDGLVERLPSRSAAPRASESSIGSPEGLAVDGSGNLYVADSARHVVLRIDREGNLHRVAGDGTAGCSGDGEAAVEGTLSQPFDVACDRRGNLYIAEFGSHRIRRVDPNGIIHTFAGTGERGYTGDGGPAVEARLHGPYGVTVDAQGRVLIADSFNHVIRRVRLDGTIETVAGSGVAGYAGDGGPATGAALCYPQSVVPLDDGTLFILDEHNHAIRRVGPDKRISTVVGTGIAGDSSEGTPAASTPLNDPEGLWVRPDGTLLIADGGNHRVRQVTLDGRVVTFAGKRRER